MNVRDIPEEWPVVSSAELFRGRLVAVRTDKVRMPDNNLAEREVVLHPGAVAVLALDDAGQVLLIRQYRHPVGRLLWEIPAGLRDIAGEPTWATARRELLEEAGYRARDWRKVLAGELHNGAAALGILAGYAARSEGFDRLRPADAPEEQ